MVFMYRKNKLREFVDVGVYFMKTIFIIIYLFISIIYGNFIATKPESGKMLGSRLNFVMPHTLVNKFQRSVERTCVRFRGNCLFLGLVTCTKVAILLAKAFIIYFCICLQSNLLFRIINDRYAYNAIF